MCFDKNLFSEIKTTRSGRSPYANVSSGDSTETARPTLVDHIPSLSQAARSQIRDRAKKLPASQLAVLRLFPPLLDQNPARNNVGIHIKAQDTEATSSECWTGLWAFVTEPRTRSKSGANRCWYRRAFSATRATAGCIEAEEVIARRRACPVVSCVEQEVWLMRMICLPEDRVLSWQDLCQ